MAMSSGHSYRFLSSTRSSVRLELIVISLVDITRQSAAAVADEDGKLAGWWLLYQAMLLVAG